MRYEVGMFSTLATTATLSSSQGTAWKVVFSSPTLAAFMYSHWWIIHGRLSDIFTAITTVNIAIWAMWIWGYFSLEFQGPMGPSTLATAGSFLVFVKLCLPFGHKGLPFGHQGLPFGHHGLPFGHQGLSFGHQGVLLPSKTNKPFKTIKPFKTQ